MFDDVILLQVPTKTTAMECDICGRDYTLTTIGLDGPAGISRCHRCSVRRDRERGDYAGVFAEAGRQICRSLAKAKRQVAKREAETARLDRVHRWSAK